MGADEAGPSGDQNLLRHSALLATEAARPCVSERVGTDIDRDLGCAARQ
jgi:hypothetical protein